MTAGAAPARAAYGFIQWPPVSVQLFSSLKRTGIEEAEAILAGWLGIEGKTRENKRPPEKGNPEAKIP